MQGAELAVEMVAPIGEDRTEREVIGDAEEQVDVGPTVLCVVRRRAGHRSSRDAGVLSGEPEQLPSHCIPMITGKHSAQSSWRIAGRGCILIAGTIRYGPRVGRAADEEERIVEREAQSCTGRKRTCKADDPRADLGAA